MTLSYGCKIVQWDPLNARRIYCLKESTNFGYVKMVSMANHNTFLKNGGAARKKKTFIYLLDYYSVGGAVSCFLRPFGVHG